MNRTIDILNMSIRYRVSTQAFRNNLAVEQCFFHTCLNWIQYKRETAQSRLPQGALEVNWMPSLQAPWDTFG